MYASHEIPALPAKEFFDCCNIDEYVTTLEDASTLVLHSGFELSLWPIHDFVRKVLITRRVGFTFRIAKNGRRTISTQPLGEAYPSMNAYLSWIPKHATPYGYIGLFLHCCRKLHLDINPFPKNPQAQRDGMTAAECYNELIVLLRHEAYAPPFIKATRTLGRYSQETFSEMKTYVDELFAPRRYSKLLVVRVDLSFRKIFASAISWSEALEYFKRFLANRRWNRIFNHCVGYIRKLEYTPIKGPHFHLMLFFNGQLKRGDIHLAAQVCDYWKEVITHGKGYGHSCNQTPNKYRHWGIGMIGRNDQLKRANFLYALTYLCKKEQLLPLEVPKGTRVITRGEMSPSAPAKTAHNSKLVEDFSFRGKCS